MIQKISVLTLIAAALILGAAMSGTAQTGNLGYNSYEGYLTGGAGPNNYFGPGVGYPTQGGGDYYQRYIPPGEWGRFGYGTGHLGQGYGPYVFGGRRNGPPRGMFDPLPGAYAGAPPPSIRISGGTIRVAVRDDIPGVTCVTVTMVAFNNADLAIQTRQAPPYTFTFPVLDGVKNVRVRIDYVNEGFSATSYPL